jgi:hypothetical protein
MEDNRKAHAIRGKMQLTLENLGRRICMEDNLRAITEKIQLALENLERSSFLKSDHILHEAPLPLPERRISIDQENQDKKVYIT